MVSFKSVRPLAGLLLFLAQSASAIPARAGLEARTAAASTSTGASSTGKPSSSTTTPSSTNGASPTSLQSSSTMTNMAGIVQVCTKFKTQTINGKSTEICIGAGGGISTVTSIYTSWQSEASALAPITAPSSGCANFTSADGADQRMYCTCAGSGGKSASQVNTILGFSSGTMTTACNTGAGSLPTGYVEVPDILQSNAIHGEAWATPPAAAVSGNCTNANTLDPRCWDALDMDEYVKWWWGAFKDTCNGASFAECFFISVANQSPTNCDQVNPKSACSAPTWQQYEKMWNGIRNFYVAWNIWNVNAFYTAYYTAIADAETTALAMLGNIIKITDPPKKQQVGLNNILTALSVGLAFIPGPEAQIWKSILVASQQSVVVSKYMFPTSAGDTQLLEMQDISMKFGQVVTSLQTSVAQALPEIQNNATLFAAIASNGAFSQNLPNLDNLKNQILSGLNTYLISQAYQAQGVIITRQLNTSVHDLATNGTKTNWKVPSDCANNYDGNNICDTFWYDPVDHTTYAFTSGDKAKGMGTNYHNDMAEWFSNYTTPELLIKGSALCAAASKSNQGNGPTAGFTGDVFNTMCLSNMKVCTWALGAPPTNVKWPTVPEVFSDCTNDFAWPGGVDGNDEVCGKYKGAILPPPMYKGPRQYLGLGLFLNQTFGDPDVPDDQTNPPSGAPYYCQGY